MNKKFRKFLSVILCAVLLFTTASVAFAADEYEYFDQGLFSYRVKDGEAEIKKCDPSAVGDVVIPAVANGYPVTYVGGKSFENCSKITSITVGENVRYFRYNPFPGCSSLERFIVYGNNSHYMVDKYGVLYSKNMKSLIAYPGASIMEDYIIPDGVEYVYAVFDSCANLKTLTVPESVNFRMNCKFNNCPNLTDVYVGDIERSWELMDGGDWDFDESVTVHCRKENIKDKFDHFLYQVGCFLGPIMFFGTTFGMAILGLISTPFVKLWQLIEELF